MFVNNIWLYISAPPEIQMQITKYMKKAPDLYANQRLYNKNSARII